MKVIITNGVSEKEEYEFPQRQSGTIHPVGPKDGPAKYYTGYYQVKGVVTAIPVKIIDVPRQINEDNEDIEAEFELVGRSGKFPNTARFIKNLG